MFDHQRMLVRFRIRRLWSILTLLVIGVLTEGVAYAEISFTGNVDPDPATWGGTTTGYIGKNFNGMLTVDNGSDLLSQYAYFGNAAGVLGVVNVDGTGSTWTNGERLYIGGSGSGALNITNGGSVSAVVGWLGYGSGSSGTMTVSGTGSIWTTSFYLFVGGSGSGRLMITNGGTVQSNSLSYIGDKAGSSGTVTVSDAGSTWTSPDIRVGSAGAGTLNIVNGAVVKDRLSDVSVGGTGIVTVDGAGSAWINETSLTIGTQASGYGQMLVRNGGSVSSANGHIGQQPTKCGTVTVVGTGSMWSNSIGLDVGQYGQGTLSVVGGGAVTAGTASINNQSLLAIDVGCGSSLTVGTGSGTITNRGTVRVLAGAGVPVDGVQYSPISAGSWRGTGTYQAVGGTWSASEYKFTASSIVSGTSGSAVPLDLALVQRALVKDNVSGGTNWKVGASFLAAGTTTEISFTATAMDDTVLNILKGQLPSNESVLSGWEFATTGYDISATKPVYLSFDVGAKHPADELEVWHYDANGWAKYDALDLTYDGAFASFTATGFSGYAMVAVPEPSTLILIAIVAISLLGRAWRRRV